MAQLEALVAQPPPIRTDEDGIFRVGETRVRLDTVIDAFNAGCSPEEILLKYPSLSESALERAERLEQLRILEHGYRIKVGITQFDCISVDTQDDVRRVIEVLKSRS